MSTDPRPRKQKQKEPRSQQSGGADRLKTVVRRLPPNLPEDVFWQSVQAWVSDETVTWKSYHPGKLRTKRAGKEGVSSRAYIAFRNEGLVATFSRAYDGHVFRDKAGNEAHAVVEYAPFQKVPAEKRKTDARNNTIDGDDDYLRFLETLKGGTKPESTSLEALVAASQPGPQPTTTPLLEALKAEKSAQRDKEAILRNHAHYKEIAASKKEEKKKAAQPPPLQGKGDAPGKKKKAAAQHKALEGQAGKVAGPSASAKGGAPVPPAAVASASTAPPASSAHGRRPPKDRSQVGKNDASAPGPAPALPMPMTTEPSSPAGPAPRKNRPVIGLGRQFEVALSGAGVGVSQGGGGERKRRDKGEGVAGTGTGGGAPGTDAPGSGKGKQKHREERQAPAGEVVPSILQRAGEGGSDVVIMQRPQSREGGESAGLGLVGGPGGRGGARRGRVPRGRGHRGG